MAGHVGLAPLQLSPFPQCNLALVNPLSNRLSFHFQVAFSKPWNLCSPRALPQPPAPGLSLERLGPRSRPKCLWKVAAKLAQVNLGKGQAVECPELEDAAACHELSGLQRCEHLRRCNLEAASLFPIILLSVLWPLSLPKCFHSSQPLLFSFGGDKRETKQIINILFQDVLSLCD